MNYCRSIMPKICFRFDSKDTMEIVLSPVSFGALRSFGRNPWHCDVHNRFDSHQADQVENWQDQVANVRYRMPESKCVIHPQKLKAHPEVRKPLEPIGNNDVEMKLSEETDLEQS